jgi:hypothetical protein
MRCEFLAAEWPAPSQEYLWSFYAWLTYLVVTEEFDRTLPGAMSTHERDSWLVRPDHRAASSRFALAMKRELLDGVSREGERAASRFTLRDADAELERRAIALVAGHDPAGMTVDNIDWGELP